jgi:hypothetical protein
MTSIARIDVMSNSDFIRASLDFRSHWRFRKSRILLCRRRGG